MNSSWNRWIARLIESVKRSTSPRRSSIRRGTKSPSRPSLEGLEDRLAPATLTWTGLGGTGLWATPTNWNLNRAPVTGDDLVFGSAATAVNRAATNNLASSVSFRSITVSAGGYTLASVATTTTTLTGSLTVDANLGIGTLATKFTMDINLRPSLVSPNQTFSVGLGTELVMSGKLAGTTTSPSSQVITKVGGGVLTLTGDNTAFTGGITLAESGGVVYVGNSLALGGGTGVTTVNTNSQLQIGSVGTINEPIRINGSGVDGNGAILNMVGTNVWAGNVIMDSNSALGAAIGTVLNVSGEISDTGSGRDLTKVAAGEVIFGRVGGNSYRGQTIVDFGTLTIRDPLSLGAGANALRTENGTPQSQTIVNYNSITGRGGTLQLEFVGLPGTDPNAILRDSSKPFDATTNPVVGFQVYNDRLILLGPGYTSTGALRNKAGDNNWNGEITLRSPVNAQIAVQVFAAATTNLIIDGRIGADPLTTTPEASASSETPFTKTGTGRLILTNANTYYGVTNVTAGVLNLRDSTAMPDNATAIPTGGTVPGAFVSAGAAIELEIDSGLDGTPLRTRGRDLGLDSNNFKGFESRNFTGSNRWRTGQEIIVPGTQGTFKVTYGTASTADLAFDISPTALQTALNNLTGVSTLGGVAVTQVGNVYRVVWNNFTRTFNPNRFTVTASGGSGASIVNLGGLTIACHTAINSDGITSTGAIRSLSGVNVYTGNLTLASNAAIGVEAQGTTSGLTPGTTQGTNVARAASLDDSYFVFDASLTVQGEITNNAGSVFDLTKLGAGHLILPRDNSYEGDTYIRQGWVTARNNLSVGDFDLDRSINNRNFVRVFDGAALHLLPFSGSSLAFDKNIILAGLGISHPYAAINRLGALENLGGINTAGGLMSLENVGGIGVEEMILSMASPVLFPVSSQLTLNGPIRDFGTTTGGFTKLGSRRLIVQSTGTYTGPVEVASGVLMIQDDAALGVGNNTTTTVQDGAAIELATTIPLLNGGIQRGLNIWGETLILNGSGNLAYAASTLTIHGDERLASTVGNNPIIAADYLWQGPIRLNSDATIKVQPNNRIQLTGNITDTANTSPSGSGITFIGGGELYLSGTNSYRGTTTVTAGGLTVGGGQALGSAGNAELQTLSVTGPVVSFRLTVSGLLGTGPIALTGNPTTDAASIQAALQAVPVVGSGLTVAAGALPGTYVIRLGGLLTGFDQPTLTATVLVGSGSVDVVETVKGAGATIIADKASMNMAGSFTVAGEPLLVQGQGRATPPSVPLQWFNEGPSPLANGQTVGNQNVAGRVTASAVDPTDPNLIYMATAGGGAWRTIDGGKSWRPMFDAIPEIQTLTMPTTAANFTLTFGGQTTATLNSGTVTAQAIQDALNGLTSISSVSGLVTVTKSGNVFRVTFGGQLTGRANSQITATGGVVAATLQEGIAPQFAMYIGSIVVDPNFPNVVYLGTGETNNTSDSFYGTGIYRSDDYGVSWTVFRGNMQQKVEIGNVGTATTPTAFTLSFTGPDSTGASVTRTTTSLAGTATATQVATALNNLSNISGIGANVVVTAGVSATGNPSYTIEFQGTLAKQDVSTLVGTGTATPTVSIAVGSNPFYGKGISKIAIDPASTVLSPNSPRFFLAVGEGGDGANERHRLSFRNFPNGRTFTITLTAPDATGALISATTVPISWVQTSFRLSTADANQTAAAIQAAMQNLPNVNGVGGVVTVTPVIRTGGGGFFGGGTPRPTGAFNIDYGGSLSQTSIQLVITDQYTSQNAPSPTTDPIIDPTEPVPGGPIKVRNGTGGNAGLWRYQNGVYFLMTNQVSANRATLNGQTNPPAPPKTPGPDDDFRISFPQSGGVTWTDVSLTYAVTDTNGAGPGITDLVVYGALGSSQGNGGNGLYRCENPTDDAPIWYIGDHGSPQNQVDTLTLTVTNPSITNQQFNLIFKGAQTPNLLFRDNASPPNMVITAAQIQSALQNLSTIGGVFGTVTVAETSRSATVVTFTITYGGRLGLSPQPLIQGVAAPGMTIGDVITTPGGGADTRSSNAFPTGSVTPPTNNGNIKFTVIPPAGPANYPPAVSPLLDNVTIYASVSLPNGALRAVYKSTNGGKTYSALTLPSNFLSNVGNYANAIYAANANTVYVGGTAANANVATQSGQIYVSTDGGTNWNDLSSRGGVGPHVSQHSIIPDSNGNLLFGNDGGLWQYNPTANTWTNLNGNLATLQVNSVASDPTSIYTTFAGLQTNGTAKFSNSQTWSVVDKSYGGQMGGNQVYIDPNNSNILYSVQTNLGTNAVVRRSLDGGQSWTTIRDTPDVLNPTIPLVLDQINTSRVLVAGRPSGFATDFLYESLDRGNTWVNLNPPINVVAMAIPAYQGTYAPDNDFLYVPDRGINSYDSNTVYITDGTSFYVTKDRAQNWIDRSAGLGGPGIVNLVVDPRNRDTVYAVRNLNGLDQIYYTTDAGVTWEEIGTANGLGSAPAWKLVLDPRNSNLYIGTDLGVFQLKGGPANWSSNGGTETWKPFGYGMPLVQVHDLELNQTTNTLLAGTYGRSVYRLFLDAANTTNYGTSVSASVLAVSGKAIWAGPVIVTGDPTTGEAWFGSDGAQNLPNGLSAAQVEFRGPMVDLDPTNPATIVKVGPGDVIFSGPNTYLGMTKIREGVLVVDNLQALGSPDAPTVVSAGSALELLSSLNDEPITLQGDGYSFDGHFTGALRNVSGDNFYTGPLTLDSSGSFTSSTIAADSGSSLTITGPIDGGKSAFTLVKELSGTIVFAADNTYIATTRVNQGALRARHSSAFNQNDVVVLDGAAVELGSDLAGDPISVNTPLYLSGTGIFDRGALRNVDGDNSWDGPINLGSNAAFAPLSLPIGRVGFGADDGTSLTVNGVIANSGGYRSGIVKLGDGSVFLASANTYTGSTEVIEGTLGLQNNTALGSRSNFTTIQRVVTYSAVSAGNFVINFNGKTTSSLAFGATATQVQTALNTILTPGTVTVQRFAVDTYSSAGIVASSPATGWLYEITFAGTLLTTNLPLTASGSNGTYAAASFVAAGGVDVRVYNGATLAFDGDNAPGGALNVNRRVELGATLNGYGTLQNLSGDNTFSGLLRLVTDGRASTPPNRVDVLGGTQLTIAGGTTFSGSATEPLQKLGDGVVVFTGTNNLHAQTIVTEGDTFVVGTIRGVLLDGGTLSGTGFVGVVTSNFGDLGATYVPGAGLGTDTTPGGIIDPGDNRSGLATGNLTTAGGILNETDLFFVSLESNGSTDLLSLKNGNIDLGNAILDGSIDPAIVAGQSYTILNTVASDSIFGHFAGPSTTPVAGGDTATVAYIGEGDAARKFVVDYFSDHVVLTRTLANATATLTPSNPNPVYGEAESFTFALTRELPTLDPMPRGNVVFTVVGPSGTKSYNIPLDSSGKAVWNPGNATPSGNGTTLPLGNYAVTASFDGLDPANSNEPIYAPITSGPVSVTVNQSTTKTSIVSSLNPTFYGQSVTLTATVASQVTIREVGTQAPAGTVTFYDGSRDLGTVNLDLTGVASITTNALTAGSHSIRVVYNGDGTPNNYIGSSSLSFNQSVQKAITSTTVATSVTPSVYGQVVTFNATIARTTTGPLNPTGSVTFRLGGNPIGVGSVVIDSNGVTTASYTTFSSQLPVGTNTVNATYSGDNNYATSTGSISQQVNRANTVTTVTASPSSSTYGQQVAFTATIASVAPGAGIPNGTVTFMVGSTTLGTAPVAALGGMAQATFTTSPFQLVALAGQVITAIYNPPLVAPINYNTSSGTMLFTVSPAATTTTLTSNRNPSQFGQSVTFTAEVTGPGIPTGGVVFKLNGAPLGNGTTLSNNAGRTTATFTTSAFQLPTGANQIVTAEFSGSSNYVASSATLQQTVNPASTSMTVASSLASSLVSQPVVFTATISNLVSGTPTGVVAFSIGSTSLGNATLSTTNGVTRAMFTAAAGTLPIGTGQIVTASYAGDGNFAATSATTSQTVLMGTSTALTSSANPAILGQPVTLTATITPQASAGADPTGSVTFRLGSTVLGTATVSTTGGVSTATYTTTPGQLVVGRDQAITVSYTGDTRHASSTASLAQTVVAASSATLIASPSTTVYGQSVTLTATVSAIAGGAPTGVVTFLAGATTLGTGLITTINGVTQATYTTTAFQLPVGTQSITARYEGDLTHVSTTATTSVTVNAAVTTTTLNSSLNPSSFGQAVTFSARVTVNSPGAGNPTGQVEFRVGSTLLGTVNLSTNQGITSANLTTTSLPVGANQTVTATYLGDSNYSSSTRTVVQTVNALSSVTTLTANRSLVIAGGSVTLTANVSSPVGTPSGVVTFVDVTNNRTLGTANLSGGVATLSVALSAPTGNRQIVAQYAANGNFGASSSAPTSIFVTGTRANTTVVTSSANVSYVNQAVTFTATVTDTGATPVRVPTGTITFYDGSIVLGTATLTALGTNQARATLTTSALTQGGHTITAEYSGDTVSALSVSSPFTQTVNSLGVRASTTTLAVTPTPTKFGQEVTLTATVADAGPGAAQVPAGVVSFYDGGTLIGTATIVTASGFNRATFKTKDLTVATHTLTAVYEGNLTFARGTASAPVALTVAKAGTTTTLTTSAASTVTGQSVTFTATVAVVAPGAGTPTGNVIFRDSTTGVVLGTSALVGNRATLTTSALSAGTYRVVAEYQGDGQFVTSASTAVVQTVKQPSTKITPTYSTTQANTALFVTATVGVVAPGTGIPTGTVSVFINNVLRANVTLDQNGQILFQLPAGLPAGSYTFKFVYSGDVNFAGSTFSQVVSFTAGRLS